jgi:probable HAF family extracellular repeat protein
MDEWSETSRRGHELGNHTLFHPCRSYGGATWIQPWRDLKTYDLARWEAEVDLANLVLDRIEGRSDRSYGNTCHNNFIGPDDAPLCLDAHMLPRFVAARGTKRDVDESIDPRNLTPGNLGTLGGDNFSSGWAINSRGVVVGVSSKINGQSRAFLYSDGAMVDLNSLINPLAGWTLIAARDINNRGQIVGYGMLNGGYRAFLLSPQGSIPEPASWAMLIAGFGLVGAVARRQRAAIGAAAA